ncbi:hypothetical protein RFF05_07195 [Bengtsoniella intestinalis]|uniref:DUF1281 family ferredoxin-like fold protein n=1 Tax=Bengtsoniella intestinalis TaxID=3073143 RepID=UPI00391F2480
MPNHITNQIMFENTATLYAVAQSMRQDGAVLGSFDFHKLEPMPLSLEIQESSQTKEGLTLYTKFMKESAKSRDLSAAQRMAHVDKWRAVQNRLPAVWELGKRAYENQQNHGHATWYNWALANWGTKWNAYYPVPLVEGSKKIEFSTAWSAPIPIIKRLSEVYSDQKITHRWADENIGYNVGTCVYENGEMIDIDVPEGGTKEAYEMAADIRGFDLADYGLSLSKDGRTYEYHEPSEPVAPPKKKKGQER